MSNLKKFIEQHKDEFENEPLPKGHLERFERKIYRRKSIFIRFIMPLATVVAAASIVIFFLNKGGDINTETAKTPVYICEADEEMDNLCEYYNMRIYDVEEQIETLYSSNPSPVAQELKEESKLLVDDVYEFVENVLPSLPCTDDGLLVINLQYESSLQSLNLVLNRMEDIVNE